METDRAESVCDGLGSRRTSQGKGIVDRSTTAMDSVDEVETEWTGQHFTGLETTPQTKTDTLPR